MPEVIKGYRVEFTAHPQQSLSPSTVESKECAKAISEEVRKMVEKGAVTEVKHQTEEEFVSRLLLVPKKDGQMRAVITLKHLNRFLFITTLR